MSGKEILSLKSAKCIRADRNHVQLSTFLILSFSSKASDVISWWWPSFGKTTVRKWYCSVQGEILALPNGLSERFQNPFKYFVQQYNIPCTIPIPLLWRHNEHDCVSNQQPCDCLLNRSFRCRSKKIHQSSASLTFVRGIHRWPVNSLHCDKWLVTWKMFPFDDVIMHNDTGKEHVSFIKILLKTSTEILLKAQGISKQIWGFSGNNVGKVDGERFH